MESYVFFLRLSEALFCLTSPKIGNVTTNISSVFNSGYIKDIDDSEIFNAFSLIENPDLINFYYSVITKSNGLSTGAQFDKSYTDTLKSLPSNYVVYLLTRFKNPSEKSCVSISNDGTINFSSLIGESRVYNLNDETIDHIKFGSQSSQNSTSEKTSSEPYVEVREYDAIYINKYFIKVDAVSTSSDLASSKVGDSGTAGISLTNKLVTYYYSAKVFVFTALNYDLTTQTNYYSNFVLCVRDTSQEKKFIQDFGDAAASTFLSASTLTLNQTFFPFSIFVDNSLVENGFGADSGFSFPAICTDDDGKINTDDSSTNLTTNTMGCDLGGNIMIQYNNEAIKTIKDDQLCGPNVSIVAYVRVNNVIQNPVVLYKNLPTVTNALTVYAYNFSYVKYLKFDGSLQSFVGSASVKTTTQKYENESLNFSNYYSYNFDPSFLENGFLFTFVFRADNGTDITDYSLDVNPIVKIPSLNLSVLSNSDSVLVTSNYATKLIYYFNNESPQEVNVSDTTTGTNQKTTISTVGKYGTLFVEARNYFYDFSSIFSSSSSVNLNKTISLTRLILKLYRVNDSGSSIILQTFYDAGQNVLTQAGGDNITQGSILNYKYYSANTSSLNFGFRIEYTYPELLNFKVGFFDYVSLESNQIYTIPYAAIRDNFLDKDTFNISAFLPDGTEYAFPFNFITSYATTPTVSSVVISNFIIPSIAVASFSFSYSFANATDMFYEILDQNNKVLFKNYKTLTYSTSSASDSIDIEYINIDGVTSLTVRVTTRSLSVSSGVEDIKTATSSSSAYNLPLRLSLNNPAAIKFYSDSGLTNEITNVGFKKGQEIYIKFLLYDLSGSEVNVSDYYKYIVLEPSPTFYILGYTNPDTELSGVTLRKIVDYYKYSILILPSSSFNENQLIMEVEYQPTYRN